MLLIISGFKCPLLAFCTINFYPIVDFFVVTVDSMFSITQIKAPAQCIRSTPWTTNLQGLVLQWSTLLSSSPLCVRVQFLGIEY